jgi:uncharacterized protein involved in exopolysaccharide biosynthesis
MAQSKVPGGAGRRPPVGGVQMIKEPSIRELRTFIASLLLTILGAGLGAFVAIAYLVFK